MKKSKIFGVQKLTFAQEGHHDYVFLMFGINVALDYGKGKCVSGGRFKGLLNRGLRKKQ